MLSGFVGAALALGFVSSAHCAAMCGPLSLAGCTRDGAVRLREIAAYAAGRLTSYAMIGALLGQLGRHATCRIRIDLFQTFAVVAIAAFAAWRGVRLLRKPRPPDLVPLRRAPSKQGAMLRATLAAVWPRRGGALGLATGVMPCGVLLPAWGLAAASSTAAAGALVMIAFALATSPGLALPLVGKRLLGRIAPSIPRPVSGLAWCAFAIWMALRPLLATYHCHL